MNDEHKNKLIFVFFLYAAILVVLITHSFRNFSSQEDVLYKLDKAKSTLVEQSRDIVGLEIRLNEIELDKYIEKMQKRLPENYTVYRVTDKYYSDNPDSNYNMYFQQMAQTTYYIKIETGKIKSYDFLGREVTAEFLKFKTQSELEAYINGLEACK